MAAIKKPQSSGTKKYYVYSTLTASHAYTTWKEGAGGMLVKTGQVTIKGGANVADKHLETPLGVVTIITESELEQARRDQVFGRHEERGFLKVEAVKKDVEDAVSDMEARDESAPLTPDDFLNKGEKVPTVNTPKA